MSIDETPRAFYTYTDFINIITHIPTERIKQLIAHLQLELKLRDINNSKRLK
jgi:hypothetical protein